MRLTAPPDRILMIRPSALGDVCRTVPVLATLRAAWPEAVIHWVVQDSFADAVRGHPALDAVISFPRQALAQWWKPAVALQASRWFRQLRRGNYDLVIDCQGLGRSGLMTYATRAKLRVGHRAARELAWLSYNHRVGGRRGAEPQKHAVDAMLELVDALGIEVQRDMSLHLMPQDRSWWQHACSERRGLQPAGRLAVLAPSSRWKSKRWPAERWIELIDPLAERGFGRFIVLAAPGEEDQLRPLVDAAATDRRIINLAGQTSIGQTMAVIERGDLLIANDSAPLHMAVGLATPCLGLFGPTDPAIVGPYQGAAAARALRRFNPAVDPRRVHFKDRTLGDELMRLIAVDDVLAEVDSMLASAGAAE